jgi:hypothetical protein
VLVVHVARPISGVRALVERQHCGAAALFVLVSSNGEDFSKSLSKHWPNRAGGSPIVMSERNNAAQRRRVLERRAAPDYG